MPEIKIKVKKPRKKQKKEKLMKKIGSKKPDLANQIQNLAQKIGSMQSQYMSQQNQNIQPSRIMYIPQHVPQLVQQPIQQGTLEEVKKHTAPILEEIKQFSVPLLEYSKNMMTSVNDLKNELKNDTYNKYSLDKPAPLPSGFSNPAEFQSSGLHYPNPMAKLDTSTIGGPGELKPGPVMTDKNEVAKYAVENLGDEVAVKTVVQQTSKFVDKKNEYLELYKSIFGHDYPGDTKTFDKSDVKGMSKRIKSLKTKWKDYNELFVNVYGPDIPLENSDWMPSTVKELNAWYNMLEDQKNDILSSVSDPDT